MINFRKGTVNCLFATSVAEEGLDIPDCNLVIRFDLYSTLIQYIQSRGRARHTNSRYIHMHEANNQEHRQLIAEVRSHENVLKSFCSAMPEDRKLTGNNFDLDHFLAKERTHRVYTVPETGAKLTYRMSLMVLTNFVDSLPHPPDSNKVQEYVVTVQSKQFLCEVILPEASPIRGAIGRLCTRKQVAKCSAAFETCLLLRKGKYLDENLLPTFTKQLPAMSNALLAVDSKKREAYDMRTKPSLWSVGGLPEELFVTVLILTNPNSMDRPTHPLALLTRSRLPQLPSFMLHFGGSRNSPVQCVSLRTPLNTPPEVLDQINIFTLSIFEDVFSKTYGSDVERMPYFLAPLISLCGPEERANPQGLVAWEILRSVHIHNQQYRESYWESKWWKPQPDDYFKDKYIVDPCDGSRKLWSVAVNHEYRPLDPVPANTAPRSGTRKNNDNILEYSSSLWANARKKVTFDENQRVIEASYIPLRRNLLDPFDEHDDTPKTCFVVIEPLKISPVRITSISRIYLTNRLAPHDRGRHGVSLPSNHSSS